MYLLFKVVAVMSAVTRTRLYTQPRLVEMRTLQLVDSVPTSVTFHSTDLNSGV